jgi:hypothetical protein
MKETLLKKIEEMVERGIEIRKELSFNLEDLQDNPNICIAEVLEYLTEHADKIEDYWLEHYVKEENFKPTLVLHMKLTEETESKLFGKDPEGQICNPSGKSWLELTEKVRDTPIFKDNPNMR